MNENVISEERLRELLRYEKLFQVMTKEELEKIVDRVIEEKENG